MDPAIKRVWNKTKMCRTDHLIYIYIYSMNIDTDLRSDVRCRVNCTWKQSQVRAGSVSDKESEGFFFFFFKISKGRCMLRIRVFHIKREMKQLNTISLFFSSTAFLSTI
jgi:hypothetical protein